MPSLEQYKNAIAAAQEDGNESAVAELRERVGEAAEQAKSDGNMEAYGELAAVAEFDKWDDNTFAEDLQAVGQKMLNFVGTGEEIAAGGRAGLSMLLEPITKKVLGLDYESEFSMEELARRYDEEYAEGQRVEENLERDAPVTAVVAEVAPQIVGGFGVAKALGTAATRGGNALRQGAALGGEMALYQVGEKEGDLRTRVESLDLTDAAVITAGTLLGTAGGALVRGTDPDSATIMDLVGAANKNIATAGMKGGEATAELAKGVGKYVEGVGNFATGGRVTPALEQLNKNAIAPVKEQFDASISPVLKAAGKKVSQEFDKAFTPVRTLAAKTVDKQFGGRLERGAINGQRGTEEVDRLMFDTHKLGKVRDAIQGNERAMAAMADATNNELKWEKRKLGFTVLKEELGETDYNGFMKFLTDQEDILNKHAPHTQTYKRRFGHMSVARRAAKNEDTVAEKTFREQREAGEAASRLNTSDGTMKDKLQLARLSEDGSTTSRYHNENLIENPIDSHHYFMRANAQMGEMNKALGIRGAQTAEEMDQAAKGKFYQERLREYYAGDARKADQAIELYNQTVWGSQRSMAAELQIVRNLGYSSTIANPYGALLQAHDGLNAAYMHGSDNAIKAMMKEADFGDLTMEELGIVRQHFNEMTAPAMGTKTQSFTGEDAMRVLAQQTEKLLEFSMKYSGFAPGDRFMKAKIVRSGLLQEQAIVKNNPAKFRSKWQHTFDKAELDILERAVREGDSTNDLVKQLGLMKLARLQPISAASNTYYQLSVPNARIFYMLKGFAITQLDLIKRQIQQNYKEGGIKAAGQDMARYMLLSAGGYGVVHETRQLAKGNLPDYSNVPALAFYQALSVATIGASGGTQYGFSRFQQDPTGAMTQNFIPPLGPVEGVTKDMAEMLGSSENPNKFVPDETLKDVPVIGPLFAWMFDPE